MNQQERGYFKWFSRRQPSGAAFFVPFFVNTSPIPAGPLLQAVELIEAMNGTAWLEDRTGETAAQVIQPIEIGESLKKDAYQRFMHLPFAIKELTPPRKETILIFRALRHR